MDALHFNYAELATIVAALLYRSSVVDVTQEWYKHLHDKLEDFIDNSSSDHFYLQEILP